MAVTKALGVLVLMAACGDPGSRRADAQIADVTDPFQDAYVMPDAAPPPFDAPPPASVTCQAQATDAAVQCELPPSTCLADYLIYYTGGICVDNKCQFDAQWLYCYSGCIESTQPQGAFCNGGFT